MKTKIAHRQMHNILCIRYKNKKKNTQFDSNEIVHVFWR